tara:strand:- start:165 stop:323 length:159 start_codon:yes stop_codon:yes gene_type:complete
MRILTDIHIEAGTLTADDLAGDRHEIISLAHLIHRTRMSIRQDNMNMKLILK